VETLSAWTVYWVMQADSIGKAVLTLAIFAPIATAVYTLFSQLSNVPDRWDGEPAKDEMRDERRKGWKVSLRMALATAAVWIVAALCPSTKTLCACLAVPAIANNEALRTDAADIYRLGMERLKEVLDDEQPKPAEAK
jgi:hypothetical protein